MLLKEQDVTSQLLSALGEGLYGAPLITRDFALFSQKFSFRSKTTHSSCHSVRFLPVLAGFGQNNP
jgi:hypothetical protein